MVVLFGLIVLIASGAALQRRGSPPVAAAWAAGVATLAWVIYSTHAYGFSPFSITEWGGVAVLYWALAILIVYFVRWVRSRPWRRAV